MPTTTFDASKLFDDAERALVEGTYVAVGLGVLGFQRAQVRRRELTRRLEGSDLGRLIDGFDPSALFAQIPETPFGDLTSTGRDQVDELSGRVGANLAAARTQLSGLARSVDQAVAPSRRQIEEQIDALEERLPTGARELVSQVRSAVEAPEARLRAAIGLD